MGFPNLPGVPALLNNVKTPAGVTTLLAPGLNNLLNLLKPTYAVVDEATGKISQIAFDSFLSIEYHNAFNVSNFPIEQGAFNSYNKVKTPFDAHIKVSKGSSITSIGASSTTKNRTSFLTGLENLVASLTLLRIITPEAIYHNVNLVEYDYRRESNNGAGIIIANLHFMQIMQATIAEAAAPPPFTVAPGPYAKLPSATPFIDNGFPQLGSYQTVLPGVT